MAVTVKRTSEIESEIDAASKPEAGLSICGLRLLDLRILLVVSLTLRVVQLECACGACLIPIGRWRAILARITVPDRDGEGKGSIAAFVAFREHCPYDCF